MASKESQTKTMRLASGIALAAMPMDSHARRSARGSCGRSPRRREGRGSGQDGRAGLGMESHQLPLALVERAGLVQHGGRDRELADVVQARRPLELSEVAAREPEASSDGHREGGDLHAVMLDLGVADGQDLDGEVARLLARARLARSGPRRLRLTNGRTMIGAPRQGIGRCGTSPPASWPTRSMRRRSGVRASDDGPATSSSRATCMDHPADNAMSSTSPADSQPSSSMVTVPSARLRDNTVIRFASVPDYLPARGQGVDARRVETAERSWPNGGQTPPTSTIDGRTSEPSPIGVSGLPGHLAVRGAAGRPRRRGCVGPRRTWSDHEQQGDVPGVATHERPATRGGRELRAKVAARSATARPRANTKLAGSPGADDGVQAITTASMRPGAATWAANAATPFRLTVTRDTVSSSPRGRGARGSLQLRRAERLRGNGPELADAVVSGVGHHERRPAGRRHAQRLVEAGPCRPAGRRR